MDRVNRLFVPIPDPIDYTGIILNRKNLPICDLTRQETRQFYHFRHCQKGQSAHINTLSSGWQFQLGYIACSTVRARIKT
jgi:hypothetical protein